MLNLIKSIITPNHTSIASFIMNDSENQISNMITNQIVAQIPYHDLVSYYTEEKSHIVIITNSDNSKSIDEICKRYNLKHDFSSANNSYQSIIYIHNKTDIIKSIVHKNNQYNLAKRCFSLYYGQENEKVVVKHSMNKINTRNGNLQFRINNKQDDSLSYSDSLLMMNNKLNSEAMSFMQKYYKLNVSKPFLIHDCYNNLIENIVVHDKYIGIILNEYALWVMNEMLKISLYFNIVIEIDGKIYSHTSIGVILQNKQIQIPCVSLDEAKEISYSLLYPLYGQITCQNDVNTLDNLLYILICIIILLGIAIFILIQKKRYMMNAVFILLQTSFIMMFKVDLNTMIFITANFLLIQYSPKVFIIPIIMHFIRLSANISLLNTSHNAMLVNLILHCLYSLVNYIIYRDN